MHCIVYSVVYNQREHSEITGKWTMRWCVKYAEQK